MGRYSEDYKNTILNKILSPESKSIRSVANEYSLPISTVLSWLRKAGISSEIIDEKLPRKELLKKLENSMEDKFKIIIETSGLSSEEISAYCRNKGLYPNDIEIWKQEMMDNLDSRNKHKLSTENASLKVKIRELESELTCKEKALAEATALLLLKKKAKLIWEDSEEEN